MPSAITRDQIYGQAVTILQPEKGFRVCTDTLFLAASLTPKDGECVLDVGAGVGAASLCLAYRCPKARIHGIELQRDNVHLASENIALNQMKGRVEVLLGNLISPPPRLSGGFYDHVMSNPPFFQHNHHRASPVLHKQISCSNTIGLEEWVRFCLLMTKSQGTCTLIYPADHLTALLSAIKDSLGDLVLFPLWPKRNEPAKRVIVSGIKGGRGPMRILPGLILHQPGGSYTDDAEDVLRYHKPINLRPSQVSSI